MDSSGPKSAGFVLSIECLRGSSTGDEWTGGLFHTGDVVEELRVGGSLPLRPPFKKGAAGVQKILRKSYKRNETSAYVKASRGHGESAELQVCIVPDDSAFGAQKKRYALRAIGDPNYAFGFCDRTEADCLQLQASRNTRMINELYNAPLQDGYMSYNWEKKIQETLLFPNSSRFLSILFLPQQASDRIGCSACPDYFEDTISRAYRWLHESKESGVPLVFVNIQTESLLTKISEGSSSSKVNTGSASDLSNIATLTKYSFEDYHGVDIGVTRAVRLWYMPSGGEISVEIKIKGTDKKLGFSISCTEVGFIYISSVDESEETPSTLSGLSHLYREATSSSRLLVISRISNQKILPWLVSSAGAIRCYDTISLSHKLSLHRLAKRAIIVHLFSWDREHSCSSTSSLTTNPSHSIDQEYEVHQEASARHRDALANISFRFGNISIPDCLNEVTDDDQSIEFINSDECT